MIDIDCKKGIKVKLKNGLVGEIYAVDKRIDRMFIFIYDKYKQSHILMYTTTGRCFGLPKYDVIGILNTTIEND